MTGSGVTAARTRWPWWHPPFPCSGTRHSAIRCGRRSAPRFACARGSSRPATRRRRRCPEAVAMQARRIVAARCFPALSATRAAACTCRRRDCPVAPHPVLVPGTSPSRRTPATQPQVRPRCPTYPPKTPAACCRTPDRSSLLDSPDRSASHVDVVHTSVRTVREPFAPDGAATSSSRDPWGRTEHESTSPFWSMLRSVIVEESVQACG